MIRARAIAAHPLRAAALLVLAGTALAVDWSQLGFDTGRSRVSPEPFGTSWTAVWSFTNDTPFVASPVAADGFVVVADTRGRVRALRESDGTLAWTVAFPEAIYATPAVARGRVVVATTGGQMVALDLQSGATLWSVSTRGNEHSSPLASGNFLYAGSGFPNRRLEARTLDTGALAWSAELDQVVYSSPAVSGGRVYIVTTSGWLYSVDQATGALQWSFSTSGQPTLASPLVSGNSIYLAPGYDSKLFLRIDTDPAAWGTANWSVAITDPNAPPPLQTIGSWTATSSPMEIGGRIVFLMRFDYAVDTNGDGWQDTYQGNEYAVAVDPVAKSQAWKIYLGTRTGPDMYELPSHRVAPSPLGIFTPSGPVAVIASSVSTSVRLVQATNGVPLASYATDSTTRASPTAANGRVLTATESGVLTAWANQVNRPPLPPMFGFSPAGGVIVTDETPTLSWDPAWDPDPADPAATLSYWVRADYDGEVLLDWDFEALVGPGATSVTLPPVPPNTQVTWRVRTQDAAGAFSEWSAKQLFWVNLSSDPPLPPSNLTAAPGDGQVHLTWSPSPSPDVVTYRLAIRQGSGPWGPYSNIGNVTSYLVTGLTNAVTYSFRLVARDVTGLDSTPVEVSAKPMAAVALNGVAYPDLPSALAAAAPGDTVQLGYGTFAVTSTLLLKEGVDLWGVSPHDTWLVGVGVNRVIQLTAGALPRGRIALLTITGGAVGIDTAGYDVVIENNVVRDMDTGVLVAAGSDVLVKNNTIANNALYGLYNASGLTVVRNNILPANGIGLYCELGVPVAATYNDVYGSTAADYGNCSAGTGSISVPVAFVDPAAGDYRVQPGQPTIDAGDPADDYSQEPFPHGWRINMGAYGNTPWAQFGSSVPPGDAGGGGGGGGGGGCAASDQGEGAVWLLLLLALLVPMYNPKRCRC